MTRALVALGHQPEVFVLSDRALEVIDHRGVRVTRVPRRAPAGKLRWGRVATRLPLLRGYRPLLEILAGASQLAAAFEARDREMPFDLVQSSDFLATGRYVKPRGGRPHVLRCSNARTLVAAADEGDSASMRRWWVRLETEAVCRSEIVYAPSQFVADHYAERVGRQVGVVRPAAKAVAVPVEPTGLPERFLLHFGQLREGKGTRWILEALPLAWREEPGLRMLMVGPFRDSRLAREFARISSNEPRLTRIAELAKSEMYGTIRRATAVVLPSLVDNLPNTVIESLMMGTPVVGSLGASIDELVEHGVTGELVPIGDVGALAQALVRAWRGEWGVRKGFTWESGIARSMEPAEAVGALFAFTGI
jgi:glycosyltransferase involved in cell wall biosynthesis